MNETTLWTCMGCNDAPAELHPHLIAFPIPKPPLGLVPRRIHDAARLDAIDAAIERYVAHLMPIPAEWLDERSDLLLSAACHDL